MMIKKYASILVLAIVASLCSTDVAYAKTTTQNTSVQETKAEEVQKNETNSTDIILSAGVASILEDVMSSSTSNTTYIEEKMATTVVIEEEDTPKAISVSIEKEDNWGYTNLGIANVTNHLNVRKEPSERGTLVGKLPRNAACEIISIEDGWAKIKSGKVDGYCSTEFLFMGEDAITKGKEVASLVAIVNTETLKVREEPNTECAVITLIPRGEELEVEEIMDNGWVKFLLDDEAAYVSGEYVDVEEHLDKAVTLTELMYGQGVSDVRVSLVQYAKQFIGNPYVWGGTSLTNGADCSGFTMSIYKKYGITLPHHAASQAKLGTKVSLSEALPGDLVFYDKNGVINHVAIYIGGGQVVHASNAKTGIKISNVTYRTPAAIRRFISN